MRQNICAVCENTYDDLRAQLHGNYKRNCSNQNDYEASLHVSLPNSKDVNQLRTFQNSGPRWPASWTWHGEVFGMWKAAEPITT